MSWIIPWNGTEYDVDPSEFTGLELKLLKQRTGLTYKTLLSGLSEFDGEAICGLFWVAARRTNPNLPYTDFEGPPVRLVMTHLEGLNEALEELGKAMGMTDETENRETSGSDSSPSTPAGTEISSSD